MKGFGAGFLEVVAAFKLGLKNRKGFMVNDGGVEKGSTTQWEVAAGAKTGSRGKHRTFV